MANPVFIQGQDYTSDTETCRRLARNVVEGDFTDDQIIEWQVANYSTIVSYTGISNWSTSDVQYYALKGIETEMTAADIELHYGENIDAAITRKAAATAELNQLISATGLGIGTEAAVGANMAVVQTSYRSWNLNPDVPIPRRGLRVH